MRALWLADTLRAAGLDVVEISGWKTLGSDTWNPTGGIVHATADGAAQNPVADAKDDASAIAVIRNGRPGLPGPIANAYQSRSGVWFVIASGRCNTALTGTHGPLKGLSNTNLLGIEHENDNRSEPWPDAQYQSAVRGWAAICKRLGWKASRLAGHKEHDPRRKSDPKGIDMDRFRADVAAVLAEGDEMAFSDEVIDRIATRAAEKTAARVWGTTFTSTSTEARWPGKGEKSALLWLVLAAIHSHDAAKGVGSLGDDLQVDEREIAGHLAPLLAGMTAPQLAAAIPAALAAQVVDELARRITSVGAI